MQHTDLSQRLDRLSLKSHDFDLIFKHQKSSKNVVPDTQYRTYVDSLEIVNQISQTIALNHDYFQGDEYQSLPNSTDLYKTSLPVFKYAGFQRP